jgi:hypothetical protein
MHLPHRLKTHKPSSKQTYYLDRLCGGASVYFHCQQIAGGGGRLQAAAIVKFKKS